MVTTVVLGVIVEPKLLAVITPAHEVPLAALVAVVLAPVQRSVTVTFPQPTGTLWGAAPPAIIVPATAPLAFRWFIRNYI